MSKRAEIRREAKKIEKNKTVRYNLTGEEMDAIIRKHAEEMMEEIHMNAMEDSIGASMVLLLTIPLTILKEKYWKKSYKKKLPIFADEMIDMLNKWENGEIDIDKLRTDIWNDAGIKINRDFVDEEV